MASEQAEARSPALPVPAPAAEPAPSAVAPVDAAPAATTAASTAARSEDVDAVPAPLAPALPAVVSAAALACAIAQPEYPRIARRAGWEGRVSLLLHIGADGAVKSAQVQQSSGYPELDAAALQAARNGRCAAQPQPARASLAINFRLR